VKLEKLIDAMDGCRVAVLGDLICDRFIYGEVGRISPEAPVPVMRAQREEFRAGGAANVVHNIVSLGGAAEAFGIIGDDANARVLLERMHSFGSGTQGIITISGRPTTIKTRLVAQSQQLLRVDEEITEAIDTRAEDSILGAMKTTLAECQVLVISDYDKGVLTPRLAQEAIALYRGAGKRVVCDPKPANIPLFKGVSLLTPNRNEAFLAAGIARLEADSLEVAARRIRKTVEADAVAITAGADGIYLLAGEDFTHIPAEGVEVYDVVGAGDTVCATIALALAAGADYVEATTLANYAAGIVVGKLGLATVGAEELKKRVVGG
jgi:rfaE bifunctional protein kinase chain/domain